MSKFVTALAALSLILLTGCATSRDVTLAQLNSTNPVTTIALAASDGNSSDMDMAVKAAFASRGIVAKQALPTGARRSTEVDVVVDYTDQWRWDIVMYLRWVNINMYDASSGNLLANARWTNSHFHGFPDYKLIVKGLVDEMLAKLKATQASR